MGGGKARIRIENVTHHLESRVLQLLVTLEGLLHARSGFLHEHGLHRGTEALFLGDQVVELLHRVVADVVLQLHQLGLLQLLHELRLQGKHRLHVLHQGQVLLVGGNHCLHRRYVHLLLSVVLSDDGFALSVEGLADQVPGLSVHGGHKHHEATEQLRLLRQHVHLEARNKNIGMLRVSVFIRIRLNEIHSSRMLLTKA